MVSSEVKVTLPRELDILNNPVLAPLRFAYQSLTYSFMFVKAVNFSVKSINLLEFHSCRLRFCGSSIQCCNKFGFPIKTFYNFSGVRLPSRILYKPLSN